MALKSQRLSNVKQQKRLVGLRNAVGTLVFISLLTLVGVLALKVTGLPQVYISTTTGKCIKIIDKGVDYPCIEDLSGYMYDIVKVK